MGHPVVKSPGAFVKVSDANARDETMGDRQGCAHMSSAVSAWQGHRSGERSDVSRGHSRPTLTVMGVPVMFLRVLGRKGSIIRHLLDGVDHTIEHPLNINLLLAA